MRLGVRATRYQIWQLDREGFAAQLSRIPAEGVAALADEATIAVPMPDGQTARFVLEESPIMEPPLAAKYPEIRTFRGRGIDDPAASLRCDWTPAGFHAQIRSPSGSVYVDPLWLGDSTIHASYRREDVLRRENGFECLTPADDEFAGGVAGVVAAGQSDGMLRTYRLACAATAEYTQYHGGTVVAGLAAVVTAVNRVTEVYEADLGVRLVLVANNDLIIYTNAATDPYSNGNVSTMLSQNQSNLTTVIGSANYDVGHVFGTGGGGIAGLRVVCRSGQKAQGVTALNDPIGDPFYIDYVAHEMGHQFGGNHSFNGTRGSCGGNRNGSTAYEPGSGSTVMSYAGICGQDNLQPNSDAYFHSVNLDEMFSNITTGLGSPCPVVTATGNQPPAVDAGADYVIPAATPFALTAVGDDPDGDTLTYCWEQRDLGPAVVLSAADDGQIPLLRSFNPTPDPTRSFPRLTNLLNNTASPGERLPMVDRLMEFRVTGRDNVSGGGALGWDDLVLTVEGGAGPFLVTFPNAAAILSGQQTVTWNVANTDLPPVSTATVRILLSTDGGVTFPVTLASDTANDGSHAVFLPSLSTSTARMKVEAANSVYFDISNANFTILPCSGIAVVAAQADPQQVSKVRYLSFVPGNAGGQTAIRVKLTDLPPPFAAFNGQDRWVGPPQTIPEGTTPPTDFTFAELQCEPYDQDWGSIPLLHVFGVDVIPGGAYDVQVVSCDPGVEGNFSEPLAISTGRWGDLAEPFDPPALGVQPDALDIVGVVDKFKNFDGALITARTDVHPDPPDQNVDALDISSIVDAFKGVAYPFPGPIDCPP